MEKGRILAAAAAVVAMAAALPGKPALAQEGAPKAPVDCAALQQDLFADLKQLVKAGCTPSQAQIAKLLDNPVGNFIAIPFQYDYVQMTGPRADFTETLHRFQVVPMFPIPLGKDWNLINRAVFPFLSVPVNSGFGDCVGYAPGWLHTCPSFPDALADPFDPTGGFGDVVYVALASPKAPVRTKSGGAIIWGVGPTTILPTASQEVLGTGKWSLGPAVVAAYLGKKWTLGLLAQQWWSVAGESARDAVNVANFQYFLFYAPPLDPEAQWRIGMSPNVSVSWKAKGDKVTLPVGLGVSRMLTIGKLPVRLLLEADYAVIHPDDKPGSRWDFRFYFIPVIPTFLF